MQHYEDLTWSDQTPCEKSFQTVFGLPIFPDMRVWLLIKNQTTSYIRCYNCLYYIHPHHIQLGIKRENGIRSAAVLANLKSIILIDS